MAHYSKLHRDLRRSAGILTVWGYLSRREYLRIMKRIDRDMKPVKKR